MCDLFERSFIVSERDKKEVKSINIEQVVSYLNHTFARASDEVFGALRAKAVRGTTAYKYQVDHCYLIDEIQRGPTYMLPKVISTANDNIAAMKNEKNV